MIFSHFWIEQLLRKIASLLCVFGRWMRDNVGIEQKGSNLLESFNIWGNDADGGGRISLLSSQTFILLPSKLWLRREANFILFWNSLFTNLAQKCFSLKYF